MSVKVKAVLYEYFPRDIVDYVIMSYLPNNTTNCAQCKHPIIVDNEVLCRKCTTKKLKCDKINTDRLNNVYTYCPNFKHFICVKCCISDLQLTSECRCKCRDDWIPSSSA